MNVTKIEENLQALIANIDEESFIYDLLLAYGLSKSAITRLKTGSYNVASGNGEVLWKKKVFFKQVTGQDLHAAIDGYRREASIARHSPRFIIVTDFSTLLAVDTKTDDTLDIPLAELNRHYDFFLPWAGREKAQVQIENPADVKAAGRMAQLYDEICRDNPYNTDAELHALNVFLCRLLFCFFAEDTEIFKEQACFTNSLKNQTQEDGSDVSQHLERLFEVLSLPENDPKRKKYPAFLQAFPYVNGGLFKDEFKAPSFSKKSRKLLLDSGDLDWSAINPDIFGSMMQAVVHRGQRASLGMHYTSVPNIMKVIEPLFLNELREELDKAEGDIKKLEKLHNRIQNLKIFDPACGSGNFLIIAYKELRRLEMDIFQAMQDASGQQKFAVPMTSIQLTQFYGIEIDDFAHEIATLSLWLAEHQMNVEFKDAFGVVNPSLPLKPGGNIVCENSTRIDWETVCPIDKETEIYLLGNPPYLGSSNQDAKKKADMAVVFQGIQNYKNLDYIACWFLKGSKYIQGTKAQLAFVSTNSICQGEQVDLLWPHIFRKDIEISFAHRSFKWQNNAKHNAGVTVVIIGLRNTSKRAKPLYYGPLVQFVENITPYLSSGKNIIVRKRSQPISNLPEMTYGNKAVDGGNLILLPNEMKELISAYPDSHKFFKKLVGSNEFINGQERWCLWIPEDSLDEALKIPPIVSRIQLVKEMRLASRDAGANQLAQRPYQFRDFIATTTSSVIIPSVSSERREYIPAGFIDSNTVINNLAFAVYEAAPWIFAVISSKMHNVWVRAVAGRLEERIRYSNVLCYNTFPFPTISAKQQDMLTTHVFNIIEEREKHPEKTIAQLYDPDKMPAGLQEAHKQLDIAVEQCYRIKPFVSDEERLEYLFKLYEEMTNSESLMEIAR
jgi:hypothetical protein